MRTAGATATTVTPGTKATLNEGYWLFVTDSGTTSDLIDKVGTAPIYAVVGGSAVTVDQKSSLPTVNKYIKNDATGSGWTKAADSQIGQRIDYTSLRARSRRRLRATTRTTTPSATSLIRGSRLMRGRSR